MSMGKARYIIIQHDGQWKINLDNKYYGPFDTPEAAAKMAIETAQKAADAGFAASVILMHAQRMETLWSRNVTAMPG